MVEKPEYKATYVYASNLSFLKSPVNKSWLSPDLNLIDGSLERFNIKSKSSGWLLSGVANISEVDNTKN